MVRNMPNDIMKMGKDNVEFVKFDSFTYSFQKQFQLLKSGTLTKIKLWSINRGLDIYGINPAK